jgi:hypothetical protein
LYQEAHEHAQAVASRAPAGAVTGALRYNVLSIPFQANLKNEVIKSLLLDKGFCEHPDKGCSEHAGSVEPTRPGFRGDAAATSSVSTSNDENGEYNSQFSRKRRAPLHVMPDAGARGKGRVDIGREHSVGVVVTTPALSTCRITRGMERLAVASTGALTQKCDADQALLLPQGLAGMVLRRMNMRAQPPKAMLTDLPV